MNKLIGFIYLFTADPFLFKIGVSNNPLRRKKEVSKGVIPVKILFIIPTIVPYKIEKFLHYMFKYSRTRLHGNGGTEFFKDIIYLQQIGAIIIMFAIFMGQALSMYFLFN